MEKGKSYLVLHPSPCFTVLYLRFINKTKKRKRMEFLQKEWSARKAVAQVYLGLKINQFFILLLVTMGKAKILRIKKNNVFKWFNDDINITEPY